MPRKKEAGLSMNEQASLKTETSSSAEITAGGVVVKAQSKHKDDSFPVGIRLDIYNSIIDNIEDCHWHNDLEFGILLKGSASYSISGVCIELQKGDGFFVNSNVLHMESLSGSEDAVLYTLTFPATMLYGNMSSTIYTKYFAPLFNKRIEGLKISADKPFGGDIKEVMLKITELDSSAFGYELECQGYLNMLWVTALRYMEVNKDALLQSSGDVRYTERMKAIISYIQAHYSTRITAADIAKHLKISRGECFRCFKQFMNRRIVEYINEYRLQMAVKLLRETDRSIIEISTECGFDNVSYFGKLFKEEHSMSPLQYRKAHIWTGSTLWNINGYDYEYWKDTGSGTMIIPNNAINGSFSCKWSNINNILFRSGKKFKDRDKAPLQIGSISIEFDATHSSEDFYLCVYGWTVVPLVEWYIIEYYSAYKPMHDHTHLGTFSSDGGAYELYRQIKACQPSIHGFNTFEQYSSIRTSRRLSGNVDVSAHFTAWQNAGFKLGNLAEISMAIESVKGRGSASVNTNIITIDGKRA